MTRKLIAAAVVAACVGAPAPARADVDREIVVRFAAAADARERADVRRAEGVRAVDGLYGGSQLVRVDGGRSTDAVAAELEARPEVQWATPNFEMELHALPDDARFGDQWALHNVGQLTNGVAGLADADVDAPEAWDLTTGSSDVVVAILDSGTNPDHPDLAGRVLPGRDFVDDDADPRDEHGHGSATAGTTAGRGSDGTGMTGLAQQATILPVRVATRTGSIPFDAYIQGLAFGADNADVVNLSLGGARPVEQAELDVVESHPDVLFVASAGNSAATITELSPMMPCGIPAPNVLCVAATGQGDALAGFSNRGPQLVDLAAPGVGILAPKVFSAIFSETFTAPLAGRWAIGGANASWALSPQAAPAFAPSALAESPGVDYAPDTSSFAETEPALAMDLTGRDVCRLSYVRGLTVADAGDHLDAELDDGTEVQVLKSDSANVATLSTGDLPFGPGMAGEPAVKLRFRFVSDGVGVASGAVVDNVVAECLSTTFGAGSFLFTSGTSFSAPLVSGAAVLLKAREPGVTVAGMREALLGGVDSLPALDPLTAAGGRLNARGALDELGSLLPRPSSTAADALSQTGATLHGTVEDNGRPTTARFEYGATTAYGSTTPAVAAADGPISAVVTGLAPGTTYHYRVVGENAMGTRRSADRTFTTPSAPAAADGAGDATATAAPTPPPRPPGAAATLRGLAAPPSARLRGRVLTVALRNVNGVAVTGTITAETAGGTPARVAARLASGSFRAAAGRSATVRLRLTARRARTLRRARRIRLRIVTRAAGRAPVTVRRTVRLRR